eukprot:TRINITY_DN14217_c0_g1_i1.p1 TRINITY_DN14217_c0_g1~~TRINITY_DN14217_c0_g1_i1.p1  ORF type:complete len:816 (-),score=231.26 TRINITY_DN14217_c0_g1_i1:412-2859(-)
MFQTKLRVLILAPRVMAAAQNLIGTSVARLPAAARLSTNCRDESKVNQDVGRLLSAGGLKSRSLYSSAHAFSRLQIVRGLQTDFSSKAQTRHFRKFGSSRVVCEVAVAEKEAAPVETYEYQAEVSRLLDLIVHSLYSHKEVFLRELVSNASDALDKLRFLSVTDPVLLADNPNLEIRIQTDKNAGTITITDSGIGMTREELVDSLGTIAQSGTAKFVQALKDNKEQATQDNNLIGQFGVGFYSAFLVADKVTVSTKNAKSEKQWVWEAQAESSSYIVREESDEEKRIPRGTSITLHLKPEVKSEYADQFRIESLVKNYSQFISFPIYTWQEKTREVEVEEDVPPAEGAEEGQEKEKKKVKKTETYNEWVLTNDTKPIWMRTPKDVSQSDYNSFYKSTFKDFLDPAAQAHFATEGEIEFRSLLFVPGMSPMGSEDFVTGKTKNIRLYVKRVFISDEFDGELFPRYLSFIKGVVDSNDLPLNVSREILQESRIVRIMKKRLVRKTFDMFDDIAAREDKEAYKSFWQNFGKNLKLGCIEDTSNQDRLAPLLRFHSNKSTEEMTTLDQYVSGMKEDQKAIYYLASDNLNSAKSAPFLEELSKRDLEVLFLLEPIDEIAITNLQTYKDKKFIDITKEDLDLEDGEDKEKAKQTEAEFQVLCDWFKQQLGEKVSKVQVSKRISSSPCVLVAGKFGWSANMERIMKAQAMGDQSQFEFMKGRRILEINPSHPIIKDLSATAKNSPSDSEARQMAQLLYETSVLASGFTPESPSEFSNRIYEMMALALAKNSSSGLVATVVESAEGGAYEADSVIQEGDPWKQ